MNNKKDINIPILGEKETFYLDTEISTKITWNDSTVDPLVIQARKEFEIRIQNFANFINQDLGDVIVLSVSKIIKEENNAANRNADKGRDN